MKKYFLPSLFVFGFGIIVHAQSPINNLDLNSTMVQVNPAFAGLKGVVNASAYFNFKTNITNKYTDVDQIYVLDSKLPISENSKQFTPSASLIYRSRNTGLNMDEFGLNINNQFNLGKGGLVSLGFQYSYTTLKLVSGLIDGEIIDDKYWLVNNGRDIPNSISSYAIGFRHSLLNNNLYYGASFDNRNASGISVKGNFNNAVNLNVGGQISLGENFHLIPTFFIRIDDKWKNVNNWDENNFSVTTKVYFKKQFYVGAFASSENFKQFPGIMLGEKFGSNGKLGILELSAMYWIETSSFTNKGAGLWAFNLNYYFKTKKEREVLHLY